MTSKRHFILLITCVSVLLSSGCRKPPARLEQPPAHDLIHDAFWESPDSSEAEQDDAPNTPWWQCIGGDELEAFLLQTLENNRSVRAADFRAKALTFRTRAEKTRKSPQIDLAASGSGDLARSRSSFLGGSSSSSSSESYTLGLQLRWEFDLWGRLDRLAEAAQEDALVAELDAKVLRLVIVEDAATQWVLHSSASEQLELIARQTDALQRQIQLLIDRQRLGDPVLSEILQLRSLVSELERDAASLELDRVQAAYRLSELAGTPIEKELGLTPLLSPELVWQSSLGQPRDLLVNRPDLRASLARLRAADARMHAEFLESWPKLEISTTTAFDAVRFTDLFLGELLRATVSLSAPVFDGGRRSAREKEALALREAAAEDLAATVLSTLAEIESNVAAVRFLTEADHAAEQAAEHARAALDESLSRFIGAGGSALDALVAEERLLQTELRAAESRRDHALAIVRLGTALGQAPADETDQQDGDNP